MPSDMQSVTCELDHPSVHFGIPTCDLAILISGACVTFKIFKKAKKAALCLMALL